MVEIWPRDLPVPIGRMRYRIFRSVSWTTTSRQLHMAIDPDHFADGFLHRVNTMLEQLEQLEGVRLPGDRRQSSGNKPNSMA